MRIEQEEILMRNVFSRRDFLKASAAAVLAVSAAGVLTGCGSDAQPAENEAVLGDFKIQVASAQTTKKAVTSGGESKEENWVEATIKIVYTGKGFNSVQYSRIFSATVGEKAWILDKPTGNLSSTDVPLMNTKTVQVSFKAPSEEAYTTFEKGEPLKMRITFFDQSTVFYLRYDNKNVTIKKS